MTLTQKSKTLIIGASEKTNRYANMAASRLLQRGYAIEMIGARGGTVQGYPILTGLPALENIDTVTMYVGPNHQANYIDYLKNLQPRRVIFNPGTENPELERELKAAGIEPIEACTLVMLASGQY